MTETQFQQEIEKLLADLDYSRFTVLKRVNEDKSIAYGIMSKYAKNSICSWYDINNFYLLKAVVEVSEKQSLPIEKVINIIPDTAFSTKQGNYDLIIAELIKAVTNLKTFSLTQQNNLITLLS